MYVRNKSNYHLDKGYIIQHQSFETAIELTSDVTTSNRKNIARCERTKDEKLLDEGLVSIAKTEILDLTADWSEGLDYINTGYGYDKLKMKNDFEKKLQSVLEKCNQVDQLYSTTQKVYDRIGLKSDINLRSPANNKTKSKRSLPSRKKR